MPARRKSHITWLSALLTSSAFAGAWGVTSFDNDDALDWISQLEGAKNASVLDVAFSRIDAKSQYVEAPECSMALAAAEVVAAAQGRPAKTLPAEASAWLERVRPSVGPKLAHRARAAVSFCRENENSELRQLWAESKDYQDWLADTADLLSRLK